MTLRQVDKIGRGHHGDPSSALLELLDAWQALEMGSLGLKPRIFEVAPVGMMLKWSTSWAVRCSHPSLERDKSECTVCGPQIDLQRAHK